MLVTDHDHEIESPAQRFDSPAYALRWHFPPGSFHAQFARYWLRACLTSWLGGEGDRHAFESLFADLLALVSAEATEPVEVTIDVSPDTVTCRLRHRSDPRSRCHGTVREAMVDAAASMNAPLTWGTAYASDGITCWFTASVARTRRNSPAVGVGERPAVPVLDEVPGDRDTAR